MSQSDDELFAQMDAIAARKGMTPKASPGSDDELFSQMDAIAAKRGFTPKPVQSQESDLRLIGESLVKDGILAIADLPQFILRNAQNLGRASAETIPEHLRMPKIKPPIDFEQMPLASEYATRKLKDVGVDLNTQEANTPWRKILKHGAGWFGSAAAGLGLGTAAKAANYAKASKFFGAPATLGEAAKATGLAAGLGALSGGAQELGVNPVVADIASGFSPLGAHYAGRMAKSVAHPLQYAINQKYRNNINTKNANIEAAAYLQDMVGHENIPGVLERLNVPESPIGYKGTTAEAAQNVGLSQLERSQAAHIPGLKERKEQDMEAIAKALENISPEGNIYATKEHLDEIARGYEDQLHHAKEQFYPQINPQEAGSQLREFLVPELKAREAHRAKVTKPLYEKVDQIKEGLHPERSLAYIENELKTAKGPTKKALLEARELLKPNAGTKNLDTFNKIVAENKITNPHHLEKLRAEIGVESATPSELKNAASAISDRISAAKGKHPNKARVLKKVHENILEDLASIPEEAAARKAYADLSPPVDEIAKHRTIKQAVKKDVYEKKYLIGEAEIPAAIINKSMKSVKDMDDLLHIVGKDKKTMDAIEGYINGEIVKNVTDPFGNVDVRKIGQFEKEHQALLEKFPGIKTKLKNKQNAQHMVNQVNAKGLKAADSEFKGAFEAFTGQDTDRYVRNIMSGARHKPERMTKAVELAATDKTGKASEGLRRGIVSDVNRITNDMTSAPKFINYMKQNKKEMAKAFDSDQMKIFDEIEKSLKGRLKSESRGKAQGSDTLGNIEINKAILNESPTLMRKILSSSLAHGSGTAQALNWGMAAKDWITKFANSTKNNMKQQLIREALLDKKAAIALLTRIHEPEKVKTALEYLMSKSYLTLPVANQVLHDLNKENNE